MPLLGSNSVYLWFCGRTVPLHACWRLQRLVAGRQRDTPCPWIYFQITDGKKDGRLALPDAGREQPAHRQVHGLTENQESREKIHKIKRKFADPVPQR